MPDYKLYAKVLNQEIREEVISLLEHKFLEKELELSKDPSGFPDTTEYSNISEDDNPIYLFYSGKNYSDLIKIFSKYMHKKFNADIEYDLVNANEEKLSNFKKVVGITKKFTK